MTRPRIAVAPNRRPDDYLASVRESGGEPWLLDPSRDRAPDVLDAASAVLLTGGGDVAPHFFGEDPHPTWYRAEPGRDELELELVVRALERDVPLLCICRGMQVLNVALGGTLVQDIPSMVPRAIEHKVPEPMDAAAHEVALDAGSRLATLLRPGQPHPSCGVNTRHHQALKRVASSLVVTATAPDGVIEAVERPASRFCLAVQWHPENFWRTGEFRVLFDALVAAARGDVR